MIPYQCSGSFKLLSLTDPDPLVRANLFLLLFDFFMIICEELFKCTVATWLLTDYDRAVSAGSIVVDNVDVDPDYGEERLPDDDTHRLLV